MLQNHSEFAVSVAHTIYSVNQCHASVFHGGISFPEQTILEAIVIGSVACCGAHIFALLLFFFLLPVSVISFGLVG